jgi:hypothetical protein
MSGTTSRPPTTDETTTVTPGRARNLTAPEFATRIVGLTTLSESEAKKKRNPDDVPFGRDRSGVFVHYST